MAYDLTLNVGFRGDATTLFQSVDALSASIANKPMVIPMVTSLNQSDAANTKGIQQELESRATALDVLITKTDTYKKGNGQLYDAAVETTRVWKDAAGNMLTQTEKLDGATHALAMGWEKVGNKTGKVDLGAQAKAFEDVTIEVTKMGDKADEFINKSKNMSGAPVEAARVLAQQLKVAVGEFEALAHDDPNMPTKIAQIRDLGKQLEAAEDSTKQAANANKSWSASLAGAMKQTLAYATSLGLLRQAQRLLADGIRYIIDLNKEMIAIQVLQVEGAQTPEQINALAQSFNNLAKELGATTIEVAQGSVEWLNCIGHYKFF